jgi:hypothetical protein
MLVAEKSGNPAMRNWLRRNIRSLRSYQGDQIGGIIANWVIVYFGQFIENYVRYKFLSYLLFSMEKDRF